MEPTPRIAPRGRAAHRLAMLAIAAAADAPALRGAADRAASAATHAAVATGGGRPVGARALPSLKAATARVRAGVLLALLILVALGADLALAGVFGGPRP